MRFSPDQFIVSRLAPVGVLGFRADVRNLIPHAREGILHGERILIVPHGRDECKLLRNLGVNVPAPILWRYDWNGIRPYATQRHTAALLTSETAAFVLNEMATGKTLSALFAFDYLRKEGLASSMLVVAPLSTLRQTWETEIRSRMGHLRSVVVHGPQRAAILSVDADIYIINHDGVRHTDMSGKNFDVVCVDELTAFANAQADRSKAMRKIAERATYVWGMTGSPGDPERVYGQVKLVAPHRVPRAFSRWRDKVMRRVTQFKWVERPEANDIVFEAMSPAVRFTRDQVVELPPISYLWRSADLSKPQRVAYDAIMKKLRAQFASGELNAANEGVKLIRLLQISLGAVEIDGKDAGLAPKPRLQVIRDTVAEADGKVLIFAPFVAGVHMIAADLKAAGYNFGTIVGATTAAKRETIFNDFRHSADCKGIVAHPRTMSHGLNLTEANVVIWAAPYPSLEVYEQANARITRPGQTRHQVIVRITGTPVESRIYRRLEAREAMQNALLEMFE